MTEKEAKKLIDLLKRVIDNKNVYIPFPGQTKRIDVESIDESIKGLFIINIYRGSIKMDKLSISAMTSNADQLLRIDVNASPHTNPDGRKISGNHIHLYKDGYETREAEEFDITNMDLVDIVLDFFRRFNVIKPTVILQNSLIQ